MVPLKLKLFLKLPLKLPLLLNLTLLLNSPYIAAEKLELKMDQKVTLFEPQASLVTFPFLAPIFRGFGDIGVVFFGLPFLTKQKR